MAHKVVVVSRRREFCAAASRLLGDNVHPVLRREWSLDRTFAGHSLTLVLDVLQVATPFEVERLPPLPRKLPTLLVVGYQRDSDAIVAMLNAGIVPLVVEHLWPGSLAHSARPSEWPLDLYVRWGKLAAEGVHALLAKRCGVPVLTPREAEIARLAEHGRSNGEIADLLDIAIKTVKNHLTHIYRKLGIRSRYELMARAGARRQG